MAHASTMLCHALAAFVEALCRVVGLFSLLPLQTMSLKTENITTIAKLSRLALTPQETENALLHLNQFFTTIVAPMQAVDTAGVVPLAHPTEALHEVALRLREDVASEPDNRQANQRSAPAVEAGLFLVPQVIE